MTSTIITAIDVNQAFAEGLQYLLDCGIQETSRNGTVLVAPGLVVTEYLRPWQRVLFSPVRDANPFFHYMEALWMLAGRDDVAFPQKFNSNFGQFSDDGKAFHGAYGRRWRSWFFRDQLKDIHAELSSNPGSRRAVLAMFDGDRDQIYLEAMRRGEATAKDLPCNTHCYFDLRGGKLNMTICCRSNDVIWGAYGANAVHFSMLMEYMSCWIGVPMGTMRQVSNNFHLYTDRFPIEKVEKMIEDCNEQSVYDDPGYQHMPLFSNHTEESLVSSVQIFDKSLNVFVDRGFVTQNFASVAGPMLLSWEQWKAKNGAAALRAASNIQAQDWRVACCQWLARRTNMEVS